MIKNDAAKTALIGVWYTITLMGGVVYNKLI